MSLTGQMFEKLDAKLLKVENERDAALVKLAFWRGIAIGAAGIMLAFVAVSAYLLWR